MFLMKDSFLLWMQEDFLLPLLCNIYANQIQLDAGVSLLFTAYTEKWHQSSRVNVCEEEKGLSVH